jgi:hypothetical protein
MVREAAGGDPVRFAAVMAWPIRELLLHYLGRLRERARGDYNASLIVWAVQIGYSKDRIPMPDVPQVLRGA